MVIRILLIAAVAALEALPVRPVAPPAAAVLMISIDGLRPDYVLEADRLGLRIPTLRRFVAKGSYATGVRGVTPTVTYPSHTTLVTGVAPARHGILANTTFDPLGRNQGGWYWYASDLRVPALWDLAARGGLPTASVNWPVTVGARITWNIPEYWRAGTEDDRKLLAALATPGLVRSLERTLGPYPGSLEATVEGDRARGRFAEAILRAHRPRLMLVHLSALDHEEHQSGPFSPASLATLEALDSVVAELVGAADRAAGGRATVAIVSDHGFLPVERELELGVALRRAGLLTFDSDTASRPSDWAAAFWPSGGSAAVMLKDTADTARLGRLRALLASIAVEPANGIASVIDADSLRALGGFPGAAFLVNMRSGFTTGGRTTGPLMTTATSRGGHGQLPDVPEMRASLFLVGPSVPAGRSLGVVDMRDVAPTLAHLLGLAVPGAEGRNLLRGRRATGPLP